MQQSVQVEGGKVINLPTAKLRSKKSSHSNKKSEDGQFQSPLFQNLLPEIQEFCASDLTLAVLTGPKSSGKTTVLDLLQSYQSNCHALLPKSDANPAIYQQIAQLAESNEEKILLIDNADLIPLEEFESLLNSLSSHKDIACKIILAGDDFLLSRLQKLIDKNCSMMKYATLTIAPFSIEEMKDYLSYEFRHSDKKKKLLSPKNLERIYNLSKGYPGRVNRVAAQLESEFSGTSAVPSLKRKKRWHIDLFILLSIVILLTSITLQIIQQASQEKARVVPLAKHQPHKAIPHPVAKVTQIPAQQLTSYIASIENLPEEHLTVNEVAPVDLPEPILPINRNERS